jgi:cytochrome b561
VFINVVWLIGLTVVVALFGWLVWRAWRASNPIVKWGGVAGSAFLGMLIAMITVVILLGFFKVYAPRGNPVVEVNIAGTPAQIERGEHLAATVCAACHTLDDQFPSPAAKTS